MMVTTKNVFINVNSKKIFILSFLAIVFGIGFAGFLMPKIIRMAMRLQLRVTPGTLTRSMFQEIPFPLHFRVFLFNVTNPDEVMSGGKPMLQEIGPYYFEEWKDKINVVDNKDDDTMEYDYRNTYHYRPELNGPGLTGYEHIVVAHPLLLAMALSINVDRVELIPFIRSAINGLLHEPKDIFYRGTVWDLLYGGIELNCASDAFEVTAVCSEFDSGDYGEIRRYNETMFKFAMFGNTNGTSVGRFKALRGKKNIRDLGRVIEYNGITEFDAWYEDDCNQISGTDGTIFPPFHEKEEGYTIFIPQMCRSIQAEYLHPSKASGIKTNKYTVEFDVSKFGSPSCYCRDMDPEKCPPKGLLDLFPCVGTPFAVSAPHFYKVDPAVLEKVDGLNPQQEKHEFFMHFYQYAGAPVSALARAQVNVEVVPIEQIPIMKDLQPMYLPLLWFENGVDMPKKLTNMLKYQLILGLKLQKILKYGCTLGGVLGIAFGAVASYMQMDAEEKNERTESADSDANLTKKKAQSVEVISNE